jgi:hypothetical protein
MREAAQASAAKPAAPTRPRFLSEDEEPTQEEEPAFFSATTGTSSKQQIVDEPEPVAASSRPRFAELSETHTQAPMARDFATELANAAQAASISETSATQSVGTQIAEASEEENDLDVPAFMRRLQF